jgi:hypothetical protein
MVYTEDYSQNCDGGPDQPHKESRIYGTFPDAFGEFTLSERQLSFFNRNRDTVISLMKRIVDNTHQMGDNFKDAVGYLNAKELIPDIIDAYQHHPNDHALLSLLMQLMEHGKFPEFIQSTSHKKLYKGDAVNYSAYIVYNQANEDLIIQRAMRYYNSLNQKS